MLEGAALLPLKTKLPWGNSSAPSVSGLTSIDPRLKFDPTLYAKRDRELAYRDSIVASALSTVSMRISTVWGFAANKLQINALIPDELPADAVDMGKTDSEVRHVTPDSVPFDAWTSDKDLYGRDVLLYEALANIASNLVDPPITPITTTVIASGSSEWSTALGAASDIEINAAHQLKTDLFAVPDKNLAERDNIIAAHVWRLSQYANNPWDVATRLSVTVTGPSAKEAENYVLETDDGRYRVWKADPFLSNRMRIVYDRTLRTLQWIDTEIDPVQYPAPTAFSFAGAQPAQTISISTGVPVRQDVQFYRQKAAQLTFTDSVAYPTDTNVRYPVQYSSGGVNQSDGTSLTVPGSVTINTGVSVAGPTTLRTSLLIEPSNIINIDGANNTNPSTYNSSTSNGADFPVAGGSTSWVVPIPPGTWNLEVIYTDVSSPYTPPANFTVFINGNGHLLPYGITTPVGTLKTFFLASTLTPITISWTPASTERFHVRAIRLTSMHTGDVSYNLSASVAGATPSPNNITISGARNRPDVIFFEFTASGSIPSVDITINWAEPLTVDTVPIIFHQVEVETITNNTLTTGNAGFEYWKMENTDRAMEPVVESYYKYVSDYKKTNLVLPEFRTADTTHTWIWDLASTEAFMNSIAVHETRIKTAFEISAPGDIGRPALVPDGLQFMPDGKVKANYDSNRGKPRIAALLPWMIEVGIYVIKDDAWGQRFRHLPVSAEISYVQNFLNFNFSALTYGDIESLLWDFGDGYTSTSATVSHSYATGGDYLVTLTVTGRDDFDGSVIVKTSWVAPLSIPTEGYVYTSGANGNPLGDPSVTLVTGLGLCKQVAVGTNSYYAIQSDGTLWAWGVNTNGQLGLGDTVDRATPVQVGVDNTWVQVAARNLSVVALKADGTLWTAGYYAFVDGPAFRYTAYSTAYNQTTLVQMTSAVGEVSNIPAYAQQTISLAGVEKIRFDCGLTGGVLGEGVPYTVFYLKWSSTFANPADPGADAEATITCKYDTGYATQMEIFKNRRYIPSEVLSNTIQSNALATTVLAHSPVGWAGAPNPPPAALPSPYPYAYFAVTVGSDTAYDDGSGNISASGVITGGSIDYNTGTIWSITTDGVADGTPVTVAYVAYDGRGAAGSFPWESTTAQVYVVADTSGGRILTSTLESGWSSIKASTWGYHAIKTDGTLWQSNGLVLAPMGAGYLDNAALLEFAMQAIQERLGWSGSTFDTAYPNSHFNSIGTYSSGGVAPDQIDLKTWYGHVSSLYRAKPIPGFYFYDLKYTDTYFSNPSGTRGKELVKLIYDGVKQLMTEGKYVRSISGASSISYFDLAYYNTNVQPHEPTTSTWQDELIYINNLINSIDWFEVPVTKTSEVSKAIECFGHTTVAVTGEVLTNTIQSNALVPTNFAHSPVGRVTGVSVTVGSSTAVDDGDSSGTGNILPSGDITGGTIVYATGVLTLTTTPGAFANGTAVTVSYSYFPTALSVATCESYLTGASNNTSKTANESPAGSGSLVTASSAAYNPTARTFGIELAYTPRDLTGELELYREVYYKKVLNYGVPNLDLTKYVRGGSAYGGGVTPAFDLNGDVIFFMKLDSLNGGDIGGMPTGAVDNGVFNAVTILDWSGDPPTTGFTFQSAVSYPDVTAPVPGEGSYDYYEGKYWYGELRCVVAPKFQTSYIYSSAISMSGGKNPRMSVLHIGESTPDLPVARYIIDPSGPVTTTTDFYKISLDTDWSDISSCATYATYGVSVNRTLLLKTDGSLYAVGKHDYSATMRYSSIFTKLGTKVWKEIQAAGLALDVNDNLYVWGIPLDKIVSSLTYLSSATPNPYPIAVKIVKLATGSLAKEAWMSTVTKIYGIGQNDYGRITGTASPWPDLTTPTELTLPLDRVIIMAAGDNGYQNLYLLGDL